MSELSQLVSSPVEFAGRTLSPPDISDYGVVEEEFAREHLANATAAAYSDGLPAVARDHLIRTATSDIAGGMFNWGRMEFTLKLTSVKALPLLLWLCARHDDPKITREQAKALVSTANERECQTKVLKLWGFDQEKKAVAPAGSDQNPSNGGTSSSSSGAPENSATPKSGG